MTNYCINSYGFDSLLIYKAYDQLMILAKGSEEKQAVIAFDDTKCLINNKAWAEVIGAKTVISLAHGKAIIEGCRFYLLTWRILLTKGFIEGPILMDKVKPSFLNCILKHPQTKDVIYIPLSETDLKTFKRSHKLATFI